MRWVLVLFLLTSACGKLPLALMGGGGPNVAANTQLGQTNRQAAVGIETGNAGRDVVSKDIEAETVDSVTINNDSAPAWLIVAALIGWLMPSPGEMGRWLRGLWRRK